MTRWRGVVAVEGVVTEDGRLIEPTAMQWNLDRGIPLVVTTQADRPFDHRIIGVIETLERRERTPHGALIYAEGSLVPDRLPDCLDLSAFVDAVTFAGGEVDYPDAVTRCDLRQVHVGAQRVWDECVLEVIES